MRGALVLVAAMAVVPPALAQTRGSARKPAPAPAATPKSIVPEMNCPAPLGVGVKSHVSFCEILAGRDPSGGMLITIPPHKGPATLTFDLHNLHLYSEELVRAKRAYSRYTATIGVLTPDNTLISRAVVQNEFRTAEDLVDRISGGAGPGGVKAVAPTGSEPIVIAIPETENKVSVLGEKVTVETRDGAATYSQPGRPIAVVSNVMLEYRPGPPPKPPARKGATGKGRQGG